MDLPERKAIKRFTVEPLRGESISHFLGRFRRANYYTSSVLGKLTELGLVISRWEKLYFNPFPSLEELEKLTAIASLEVAKSI